MVIICDSSNNMLKVVILWRVRSPLPTDVRWPVSDDVTVIFKHTQVHRSITLLSVLFEFS